MGNDLADAAADMGRRRQFDPVNTARNTVVRAFRKWFPNVAHLIGSSLHLSKAVVNLEGKSGLVGSRFVALLLGHC